VPSADSGSPAVSLATSYLLVTRLERIGERLGLSEALLGMVAALAADAPEITSAVTALAHHQQKVGAGVIIGSNVFNLAALIGPTRAAVLRALREPRGTADLAGLVNISPASASEHAKVLRDADLIETRREGRSVRHSLTPLGRTVLGHLRPTAEWPGDRAS